MMNKRIIGTKYLTYSEKRNIALSFLHHEVRRVMDLYTYLSAAHLRLARRPHLDWVNYHNDLGFGNCVGYHFWNAASVSKKPWVTTLELLCTDETRLRYFSSHQCRKIFCLSSWVMNAQKNVFENSPYASEILPKIQLLHPPQEPNIGEEELLQKEPNVYRFIFIGRDFFRKGGYECVKAFTRILESKRDIELLIVSNMDTKDYPFNAPHEDLIHALDLIQRSKGKIYVYKGIPHSEVMKLITSSHVGLLPTYLDSYGYSVLEFFSYGLPVITTNIAALEEINHEERGWVLNMPLIDLKYGVRRVDRGSPEKRKMASLQLTQLLYDCIRLVLENPSEVKVKGAAALNYVSTFHRPLRNIEILESTYEQF
jgi:glycosyltransferase involved in cell wall biosynthesis